MKLAAIKKIKIQNLQSPRTGNPVPNQFSIRTEDGTYFQSYETIIAFRDNDNNVTLDPRWQYSITTSKYRCVFLGETTSETKTKIEKGIYKIVDLN